MCSACTSGPSRPRPATETRWYPASATGPGASCQRHRRECLGKARCPHGEDCFAERARARSAQADVVVTNHALLAIDAITGMSVLPEHDVVIVDEAHELVDRVTGVATAELSPAAITAAVRRTGKLVPEEELDRMAAAADALERLLGELNPGRWDAFPSGADATLALVRDAAWAVRTAVEPTRSGPSDPEASAARAAALAALDEVHDAAARTLRAFDEPDPAARTDVVWLRGEQRQAHDPDRTAVGRLVCCGRSCSRPNRGPDVGDADNSAVPSTRWPAPGGSPGTNATRATDAALATGAEPPADDGRMAWTALDVGSPFDHARAGILYVARHLPSPGRDGLAPAYLDEIERLIVAAGGRTLGLFSSMRAARSAAEEMRERLDTPVLCQGEDSPVRWSRGSPTTRRHPCSAPCRCGRASTCRDRR